MSSDNERLQQAKQLIQEKEYAKAYKILQQMPSHPIAQKWLGKLDEMGVFIPQGTPRQSAPQVVIQEKKSSGCFGIFAGIFAALGIFSFVIIGCVVVACIGIIALIAAGGKAQQDAAEEANQGKGTKDNPVALGDWIVFDEVDIRPTRMIRPANDMIKEFNLFNEEPAAGAEYVLVFFEVRCKADTCDSIGSGFRLIDNQNREWEEPIVSLDNDLDGSKAVAGGSFSGWQAFQVPKDSVIDTVRISWGFGAWLYAVLPAIE